MPLTLVQTLSGHSDRVWCCSWSPNGRAIATCSGDKTIRIWAEADKDGEKTYECKQVLDGVRRPD